MADAFQISEVGLKQAIEQALGVSVRLADLTKPLTDICNEVNRRTAESFAMSKSQSGDAFPPLAQSTLRKYANRPVSSGRPKTLAELKSANRRRALGAVPQRRQPASVVLASKRPLEGRTNRLASSSRAVVTTTGSMQWVAPADLRFHMTGGTLNGIPGHPPVRNPTVFVRASARGAGSAWALEPSMALFFVRTIEAFVLASKQIAQQARAA